MVTLLRLKLEKSTVSEKDSTTRPRDISIENDKSCGRTVSATKADTDIAEIGLLRFPTISRHRFSSALKNTNPAE